MKRYYLADTWSDGVNDYCYVTTISACEPSKVYVAQIVGTKYILEEDVTDAVSNVVPIAEMFDWAHEIEQKEIYKRVVREEEMPRKKEYERAVLVRLSKEQHEKLLKIAETKKLGVAEVVREYIQKARILKK